MNTSIVQTKHSKLCVVQTVKVLSPPSVIEREILKYAQLKIVPARMPLSSSWSFVLFQMCGGIAWGQELCVR